MRPTPQRKPCLALVICAVGGIVLSEYLAANVPLACVAALCFALAVFRGRGTLSFCLLVVTVFLVRHEIDWRRNQGRFPIELFNEGSPVIGATGIVTSDPAPTGLPSRGPHSRFEMRVSQVTCGDDVTYKTQFTVQVNWAGPAPVWGDKVSLSGGIVPISTQRNPGEFNFAGYLARRGIFAQLTCAYPENNHIVAHGKGNWLLAIARASREALQRRLTLGIEDSPEAAGIVQTITLGLKQETSEADRELFQHVGALHLFVVNGLHVAILASILAMLLKPLRIYRRAFASIIIPVLFGYALITGLNPGSIRAAIMGSVMFGASFVDRRAFSFNTLAAAALILLALDANELFSTGFQFSVGVVAAIILFARAIEVLILPIGIPDAFLPRRLWRRYQHAQNYVWRYIAGLASVSIAASLGSFPFSAGYFNLVTPSGFAANLVLVPMAFLILAESIFALLGSWANILTELFNNVNWFLASGMLIFVNYFSALPAGHYFVSTLSPRLPECRITVLDLNPGQAVVVQAEGAVWLVDCGSTYSYGSVVRPFLQSCGVNRLDGLILTHGAASSIGAAQAVISDFAPREVCESSLTDRSPTRRTLHATLEQAVEAKTILEAGDDLQLSPNVKCSVLFPPPGLDARTAADKSLVLRIEDGSSRVLLMSDSAFTGEHWLLDNSRDFKASMVVINGQSPDLAGTREFISAVKPYGVVRGEPSYGAPVGQVRQWSVDLYKSGVTPFLQSDAGAVTIDLNESNISVSGFVNGQSLVRRSE